MDRKFWMCVMSVGVAMVVTSAHAGGADEPFVVLDQIGSSPGFLSGGGSSSQFPPDDPNSMFATIDNVPVGESLSIHAGLVRITKVEFVVAGIESVLDFSQIISWYVQVHSTLSNATKTPFGDIFGQSFESPSALTSGYATYQGRPAEIASFDVDFVVQPGEFWLTLVMENDFDVNGRAGILHSTIGDGPAFFAVPSLGDSFPLSGPAAMRVIGTNVPGPGGLTVLLVMGLFGTRRRQQHET